MHTSPGEPSFFYLMMADCCFHQAVSRRHPKAAGALRDTGRNYLVRANDVTSVLESQSSAIDSAAASMG
ncbi:MAG TPA: hypothetical protein VGG61_03465 [Gemmataceae bacterium]|jgi:hypothetical protein